MLASRYELDHEIGRGGMSTVWRGWDSVLDRVVAVKQIGTVVGDAPDMVRAEREARLAARVVHHNVVAVFDLVEEDGGQWLVMEHIDGPTLAAVVAERGAMSPESVAPLLEQVAGALAAAHAHGIVHRDVKPSNILLTGEGVAKLSDFGVARAQADASLTRTGLVTGSPAYLAPEVATGSTATAASDVWSLGATMFHALAGHAPYAVADNLMATMFRIVNEEPPRLDGDAPLTRLVTAMMDRDPDLRPSMAEIEAKASGVEHESIHDAGPTATIAAIPAVEPTPTTAFQPMQPTPAPSAAPKETEHGPNRRLAAVVAGIAAAALIALVAVIATRDTDPPPSPPRAAASTPSSAPTSTPTSAPTPAPTTPTPTAPPPAEPTAATLEGFATDYLTAASNDPPTGFAQLTPSYQEESGGLSGYEGFWSNVGNLDVTSVQGDPDNLTVSYRYSYDYGGERRAEDVTLDLQKSDGSYLISGAS